MACAGSARSPDMLAPAVMPVTAGKKTENTVQNVWSLNRAKYLSLILFQIYFVVRSDVLLEGVVAPPSEAPGLLLHTPWQEGADHEVNLKL